MTGVNVIPARMPGTEGGEARTSAQDPPAPMQHLPSHLYESETA